MRAEGGSGCGRARGRRVDIPGASREKVLVRSDEIKKGFERAPHRSLLRAAGLKDEDFDKPFIGIANSHVDIIPGHFFLQEYGRIAKDEIRKAGGVPFEFNTIGVDDGIAMGHAGMRYSLPVAGAHRRLASRR